MSDAADRNGGKPSWRIRRGIIFATLGWCLFSWGYAQFAQGEAMVNAVLPTVGFLASAVIGSYVFGAVWDDRGRP